MSRKTTSVNHLADTLIELDCRESCGINQEGIKDLKVLQKLDTNGNWKFLTFCKTDKIRKI